MFNDKYLQMCPMSLSFRFNSRPLVCFGISYRRTSFSCQRDSVGVHRRSRFVQTNGTSQRVRRIGNFIARGTKSPFTRSSLRLPKSSRSDVVRVFSGFKKSLQLLNRLNSGGENLFAMLVNLHREIVPVVTARPLS